MTVKLMMISLLLFCIRGWSQSDTINRTDSEGKQHGYWIIYEKNLKSEEGRFDHGVRIGVWKGYYPNGKIKHEITYQNGKPNGYAKFYYENGNISEEGIWKENKWVGDYKYYHPNGNIAYEWKYSETGKRTGVQKYYHENGKLMIEGEWKEGKESGTIKEYDNNGKLIAEKTFNDGQLDVASVKIYTSDNQNIAKKEQVEPNITPVVQETKQVSNDIGVFDGNGFHKVYTKDGKLDREGEWKNGRLIDGKKYFYDENGKLIKTTIYKNGNVVNIIYNN
ncbi:MAG: toxin-antitoxin system YwqK family antitoxin [Bacteroidales bacterium]|nr:toxin-antitoxin system YwqK family antitoxin [Bacteroidales bacterium]